MSTNLPLDSDIRKIDSVIVTSIASPNPVLTQIAQETGERNIRFYVIGDRKSPSNFILDNCHYYSLENQKRLSFKYAELCPEASYARKNIGYLLALADGAQSLLETDDDNFPECGFLTDRCSSVKGRQPVGDGWVNAYGYFSDVNIWPRGFPLEDVQNCTSTEFVENTSFCPIQQGLADDNPDVDAVYRLLFPLPIKFRKETPLILRKGQWCPFNSQNTVFFRETFPLLYLPATCSFRMTDIWRSFVAQRILWTCGWSLSFHASTVRQERNEHNLMRDFSDEVSGYLNNAAIANRLENLELKSGPEAMSDNIQTCYTELLRMELVKPEELSLLSAWLEDLQQLKHSAAG